MTIKVYFKLCLQTKDPEMDEDMLYEQYFTTVFNIDVGSSVQIIQEVPASLKVVSVTRNLFKETCVVGCENIVVDDTVDFEYYRMQLKRNNWKPFRKVKAA